MKNTVWLVNWEDLTSIWSSKEKALKYVYDEHTRIGATLYVIEDSDSMVSFGVVYADGTEDACEYYIVEYEIDELPYIEIGG